MTQRATRINRKQLSSADPADLYATNSPSNGDVPSYNLSEEKFTWITQASLDKKVAVDSSATAGYLGSDAGEGVLRISSTLLRTDSGDYITLAVNAAAFPANFIPDTDSTKDLGSSTPKYWANAYIDRIYLNNTAYLDGGSAGVIGVLANMNVTGNIYPSSASKYLGNYLGNFWQYGFINQIWFNQSDSFYSASAGNINTSSILNAANLIVSTGAAFGDAASIDANSCVAINRTLVATANPQKALYVTPTVSPNNNTTTHYIGIGGYTYWNQTTRWTAGSKIAGLSFGNYGQAFGTIGSVNLDLIGEAIFGAAGYGTTVTAKDIYGLNIVAWDNNTTVLLGGISVSNNLTATNAYTIYVHNSDSVGAGSLTNLYQLYIEKPTAATNNYQLVLAGTGAGSGIWLNGISSNVRIFASAASTLDIAIGATSTLQVTAKGFGYPTGVGGTVTQITNKSTGVTLSKLCGTITTHNAALAADAIVSFTVTNSTVAATDTIIINHASGGTLGGYTINATAAAGSFQINIKNNTTGSLSEALVIRFAVVKAVVS